MEGFAHAKFRETISHPEILAKQLKQFTGQEQKETVFVTHSVISLLR